MELSKKAVLEKANLACKNTLMETLRIEMVDFGEDYLTARMPVDSRVHQPDGVLHGGATAALAESVGSFATHVFVDTEKLFVRGLEITANHLKSVKSGFVYAKATFLHKGRTTQLLDIKVTDDDDNLISVCRLSTISLPKR
ncbi:MULTISPECIES: PaaI family thioesterase [Algibacter]|uniref:Uncharacterized protein (TIGR00369 family) n=1 Tax=Algibacter lectus TaxID=221126 RepID=A0A4R8MA08_9FLAO|nr:MULTISPECIES: PaaI family thioesterase [Algibacter]MDO7138163.1 PaaI family thioesterase [Algibacter lectus]MWW25770.1 hotdog fold thioesterase [Algibacter lectus]TDY61052.1 uncharacterized protein (TIGR00369 family) [Algibacter lectus]SFD68593.1 uncharacterized domain 1-containing protein [Algibacter lectus]